jgi:hypothetical protein
VDANRFDTLTRTLTLPRSRRLTLGGLATGLLAALGLDLDGTTVLARRKKKKKKCAPSRPKRCGNKCCTTSETCKKGKCVNHCSDGKQNSGETDLDCGGTCRDIRKCKLAQACEEDADCFNSVCVNVPTLGFPVCADCRENVDCSRLGDPLKFACLQNVCFECSRDADCPRPGQRLEQDKCVEPLDGACPAGHPCVCRQCRISADCPQDQFCDETGTCIDCATAQGQRRQIRAADCIENTCGADQDFCQDGIAGCNGNSTCRCLQTVGNQPYCSDGDLIICGCMTAADCVGIGPGVECVRLSGPCITNPACQTMCAFPCA